MPCRHNLELCHRCHPEAFGVKVTPQPKVTLQCNNRAKHNYDNEIPDMVEVERELDGVIALLDKALGRAE